MKNTSLIDLTKLAKEHENQWVALPPEGGRVIASAGSLRELQEQIAKKKLSQPPLIHRVLPMDASFAPLEV